MCLLPRRCGCGLANPTTCVDFFAKCRSNDCTARAIDGKERCINHICEFRGCGNARAGYAPLCDAHKCSVAGCPSPRCSGTLPAGMVAANNAMPMSAFCNGHACRHEGCGQRSSDGSRFCQTHKQCRQRGCSRLVDPFGEDATACPEHNARGGMFERRGLGDFRGFRVPGPGPGPGPWPWPGAWGMNAVL